MTPLESIEDMLKAWDDNRIHLYACAPQVQCGPHRVDFLFIGYRAELSPSLLAVECDGHEFHERTKEQAARDKSRDRDLVGMGIHVMRFTGSEIHRDAAGCVRQVIRFLDSQSDDAMDFCYPGVMAEIAKEAALQ